MSWQAPAIWRAGILAAMLCTALSLNALAQSRQGTRVLPSDSAGLVLGRPVVDPQGAAVGHLVDLLVDGAGVPQAGVIDVGGFIGIGVRRVAVGWSLLRFVHQNQETRIVVDMPIDDVAAGPEFRHVESMEIVVRSQPP